MAALCCFLCLCSLAAASRDAELKLGYLLLDPKTDFQKLENNAKSERVEDRRSAARSPDLARLAEEDAEAARQLLQTLAKDKDSQVRLAAVYSDAWTPLVKACPTQMQDLLKALLADKKFLVSEGAMSGALTKMAEQDAGAALQLLEPLAKDTDWEVRAHAAMSLAWKPLFKARHTEMLGLLKLLLSDENEKVRADAAKSPAWVPLLDANFTEGVRLFEGLTKEKSKYVGFRVMESPAWEPLLNSSATQWYPRVRELTHNLVSELYHETRRASDAMRRANEEKEKALHQTRISKMLLALVIFFAAMSVDMVILWWRYPYYLRWQDERKLISRANEAIVKAETFNCWSPTPKPPAKLQIFDDFSDVFGNPYVLYRYNRLKPALEKAFQISRRACTAWRTGSSRPWIKART